MKKLLGILTICLVGLFMLASCNDNKTIKPTNIEPTIVEPTIEPEPEPEPTAPTEVISGTVVFDLSTAEANDVKTMTFEGVEIEYVCKVELHRLSDNMYFRVCAIKLVQYDTYFEIEYWQAGTFSSLRCEDNEYQYTILK